MADHQLNYEQITAAARQVISRIDNNWLRELDEHPDLTPTPYRDSAWGAYLLWHELTKGRHSNADIDHLQGLVMTIGKPEDQR